MPSVEMPQNNVKSANNVRRRKTASDAVIGMFTRCRDDAVEGRWSCEGVCCTPATYTVGSKSKLHSRDFVSLIRGVFGLLVVCLVASVF
jgi:hypothetical protein